MGHMDFRNLIELERFKFSIKVTVITQSQKQTFILQKF